MSTGIIQDLYNPMIDSAGTGAHQAHYACLWDSSGEGKLLSGVFPIGQTFACFHCHAGEYGEALQRCIEAKWSYSQGGRIGHRGTQWNQRKERNHFPY